MMAQHVDSEGKIDHNLQNCFDHNYTRSSDAKNIGISGTTNSPNFSSTSSSVATHDIPNDTRNPLSNDVNVNNNSSLPPQSNNMISDTNSVVMALIKQN